MKSLRLPSALPPGDLPVRVILTRGPWLGERVPVGKHEGEWVYEVFITSLPADGFRATDVLDLYHGRGAFEGTLAGVVYGGRSRPLVLVCRSGTRTLADRLAV